MHNYKKYMIRAAWSGMFALLAGILAGTTTGVANADENACVQAYPDDITLRAAIKAAPDNPKKQYTIVLIDNCHVEGETLEVDSKIGIVGNEHTIIEDFGGSGKYIFYVKETGNLTLNDVNLRNEVPTNNAGAINNDGTVTYNSGQVSGFSGIIYGPVIYGPVFNEAKMTLNGVTIGNNYAQLGGRHF
jgi:hypothetical protein